MTKRLEKLYILLDKYFPHGGVWGYVKDVKEK